MSDRAPTRVDPDGRRRRAGLLIPLFSCPGTTSWGIGDIGDIEPLTAWLAAAGQSVLQLLPIGEMAPGQRSPYSAISAMAIDPLFINVPAVPEFAALGGESALASGDRELLDAARRSRTVDHATVRRLKHQALRWACERFVDAHLGRATERARAFGAFLDEERWWMEDYALFRAIHGSRDEQPWTEWPEPLRHRDPAALSTARQALEGEVTFSQYVQWIAHEQWRGARARAHGHGLALFGDLPFMVGGDSADVWARQSQFNLHRSLGAPPDAFSATGQDWTMPVYRWDVVAGDDFTWLHDRARRSRDLYDGYRIDHVVGFYRTYGRVPATGEAGFTPATESEQLALGERVLPIFLASGAEIVAEDLGVVPDFVRASLGRLGIPGFRVFRWERRWDSEGQPFRDPSEYPRSSVGTSGTHDTETMAVWWEGLSESDRRQVASLPTLHRIADGSGWAGLPYEASVRDVLLEALFASGSDLVLLPVQDVFGWRDRINEPAAMNERNWTFRLPWPADRLDGVAEARERQATLGAWSRKYGRI